MTDHNLDASHLEIGYDRLPVIRDLSLSLKSGSLVGLIGANGAGKTSLLLALSGQFKPWAGRVLFNGTDIYEDNLGFKMRIGYVHEKPFFYPYLRVHEFLHLVARIKGVGTREIEPQIEAALKSVSLQAERLKSVSHLSKGMGKKLAMAAALLGDPQILFLDEALDSIDVESVFKIKGKLRNMADGGKTIILSTHVLDVIEKLCHRYVVMKEGEIIADLDASEFKEMDLDAKGADLEAFVVQLLKKEK